MRLLGVILLALLGGAVAQARAGNSPQCPSQDLSTFLIAFSESIELQKAFTRFPLIKSYDEVDTKLTLKRMEKSFNQQEMQFPLIPNTAARKTKGLRFIINLDEEKTQQARAILRPDAGNAVYYFFEKNSCWELVGINDYLNRPVGRG